MQTIDIQKHSPALTSWQIVSYEMAFHRKPPNGREKKSITLPTESLQ